MMICICMNSICEAANIVDFTWLGFLAWIVVQQLKDEASVQGKVHSGHHISGMYSGNGFIEPSYVEVHENKGISCYTSLRRNNSF